MKGLKWPVLCLAFTQLFSLSLRAATFQGEKPLKIGQPMPELVFKTMLNYSAPSLKVSDLKGKVVIIDLWNVYCSPCIGGMPKLEALQQKFGKDLVVLTICFDASPKHKSAATLLEERKALKMPINLPVAVSFTDSTVHDVSLDWQLHSFFPRILIPSQIWIDREGRFQGYTQSFMVNENTVRAAVEQGSYDFLQIPTITYTAFQTPCFLPLNFKGGAYGSFLGPYIDSLKGSWELPYKKDSISRLLLTNESIAKLYMCAYAEWIAEGGAKRIINESTQRKMWSGLTKEIPLEGYEHLQWFSNNLFCYELITPSSYSQAQQRAIMIKDLDRYFHWESRMENRRIPCLVLVRTSDKDKIKSQSTVTDCICIGQLDIDMRLQHASMNDLVSQLNTIMQEKMVYDQTGYTNKIDIDLKPGRLNDLAAVQQQLAKYDLKLIETTREVPVLVLRDQRK